MKRKYQVRRPYNQQANARPLTLRSYVALGVFAVAVVLGVSSGHLPLSPAAHADDAKVVSLYADGQKRVFTTAVTTVADVLKEADIQLGAGDIVEPATSVVVSKGFFNINVYRALPVQVTDGTKAYDIQSAYQSPRLLADAAGVKLYPEDQLKNEVITDFVESGAVGLKVDVIRALPMSATVDGKLVEFRTQAKTVADALAGAGVKLGLKDTVSAALDAPVTSGLHIVITRVSDVEAVQTTIIPRSVKTVSDPDLAKGTTRVQTEGSDGQTTANYRIHYRNGVETSRETIKLISHADPVTKVVVVGTKVFFAGSVEYWRPMVIEAAAANGLDPNMMLRIMACESGGNATSVNRQTVGGEHATGLFQFLPSTWRAAGGTNDNIFDGPTQIIIAARYMARNGTSAWACK